MYSKDVVRVEYEWKPPRCATCKVFGHSDVQCPKNVPIIISKPTSKDEDGFKEVKKRKNKVQAGHQKGKQGFHVGKEQQFIYRPVVNKNVDDPKLMKASNIFETLNKVDDNSGLKISDKVSLEENVEMGFSKNPQGNVEQKSQDQVEEAGKYEGASTLGTTGLNV